MEDDHREEYQNDDVGLQIPPLDPNFPLFSENDEITLLTTNDAVDFPFNLDFDFSFDDLSFADDLLLELPEPSSTPEVDPLVLGSDDSNNSGVRVYDCSIYDAISSEESNSPDVHSSKSNSGVFEGKSCDRDVSSVLLIDCNDNSSDDHLELSRKSINVENHNNSSSSGSGSGSGSVSDCVSKSKRKIEVEERDENIENRIRKVRRSNTVDISNDENVDGVGDGGGGGDDDDDKKKARLIRNRESAQLSRQRKKQYVEELEDKVRAMHSTITDLNSKISYFMSENATLRQQLSGVGGGGVVPPPGMYPMAPMPYPWMPYPPAYMVKPQGSQVPLVPIPRLKPQQPLSAPKVKRSSEGNKEKEKGERKTKTKKVASVSLIGLLFFMLFFGGIMPMVSVRYSGVGNRFGGVRNGSGSVFKVDKHAEKARNGDEKFGHGRVLQQLNSSYVGNTSEPLVASLYVPRNDKLVKIDGNLIIHSVLASEKAMTEGPKASEETGLAIHGSYPPYPTPGPGSNNWRQPHLDRNQNGRQRALGSSSDGFTPIGSDGKLQQWFREGLAEPMLSSGMCTEVFQFDVSPTPGSIVPASSLANITSESCSNSTRPNIPKNRRILHEHTIPLNDHTFNTTEEHTHSHEQNVGLQSNKSRSSVVVSVLVDPREVGDGDRDGEGVLGSKTLPRIFVVVLLDSVKYVTYSCMLPFMGSGSHLITA